MVNKFKVEATCYVLASDNSAYRKTVEKLLRFYDKDAEWYKVENYGLKPEEIAGIAGGNGNLIAIRYADPVANTNRGGIESIKFNDADSVQMFEYSGIAKFGLVFVTRNNQPFTEAEKVYLKKYATRVLLNSAMGTNSLFAEIRASDGYEEDFFFEDATV